MNRTQTVTLAGKSIMLEEHEMVWMPTEFALIFGSILDESIQSGMQVLEIGVGSGVLAILAGLKGAHATGLDIQPDAPALSYRNWALNNLDPSQCHFEHSDIFSVLTETSGPFDFIWSNAPTFPNEPPDRFLRESRNAYEWAGKDGREVLDAMILKSQQWLKPGGKMLTVSTSKQSQRKTAQLMDDHWGEWRVALSKDIPLAEHYAPYIDYWLEREKADGEARIFKKNGEWHQTLDFIEGTMGARTQ